MQDSPGTSPTPSSFKKRQQSQSSRSVSGFFSGLKRSNSVADGPGKISLTINDSDEGSARPRTMRHGSMTSGYSKGTRPVSRAEDTGSIVDYGEQDIPTLIPDYKPSVYATPLPFLSVVVLCLCMFAEFLSASTPASFLYFMLEDFFTQDPNEADAGKEAKVAFWSGIVASSFFFAQFATSLLWTSIADKHGRRVVLFSSLVGNSVALTLFGTSKNLGTMMCARLAQGLFNGSVGVARGAVRDITDSTNEAKAYSFMSISWGLGGVVGPIIGGLLVYPTTKYPGLFGPNHLFAEYQYLLPCIVSSMITLVGSILTLFLDRDAGPRTGGIQLPTEKDTERRGSFTLPNKLVKKASSVFGNPGRYTRPDDNAQRSDVLEGSSNAQESMPIKSRRQSHATNYGTSYGYDNRGLTRRRGTNATVAPIGSYAGRPSFVGDGEGFGLAQRLLLANEGTVFNISDLWVAAATAGRNEDEEYSQMDYDASVFDDDELDNTLDEVDEEEDAFGYDGSAPPSMEDLRGTAARQSAATSNTASPQMTPARRTARSSMASGTPENFARRRESAVSGLALPGRRMSALTARRVSNVSNRMPAIFAHTGLSEPLTAMSPSREHPPSPAPQATPQPSGLSLAPIPENKAQRSASATPTEPFPPVVPDRPVSLMKDLPIGLIFQYFCLAMHGTACDQIFMTFLVTPVPSFGLGLNATHYAELVAVMVIFQMLFQFKFYPNVGPPRGKLSHLTMLRLGLCFYIPVYLFFPELRNLLKDENDVLVMLGMIFLSAFRFLGNCCAYTAIMVLTNAMTPSHLVPLANGLAQAAASCARFLGPMLGGALWGASIAEPRPYPFDFHLPFYVIAGLCLVATIISFTIHH